MSMFSYCFFWSSVTSQTLFSLHFSANQPNDKVADSLISITRDGLTGYTAHRTLEQYCDLANPFDAGAEGSCTFTVGSWNYDVLDLDWTVSDLASLNQTLAR